MNHLAKKFIFKQASKKSFKKSFGKVGLFLIFGMMVMNININIHTESIQTKKIDSLSVTTFNVVCADEYKATAMPVNFINNGSVYHYTSEDGENKNSGEVVDAPSTSTAPLRWALKGVLWAIGILIKIAASLFDTVIRPTSADFVSFFDSVVKNEHNGAIYRGWTVIRDFLNLFFMLILLFSAFATIFQVEKYHLKKMIIMLVVMALLVNFSYAIALFIMDFSNSLMNFFLNYMTSGSSGSGDDYIKSESALIAQMVNLGGVSKETMTNATVQDLILAIIFQFIILITLFAFAINLIIRIFAFAILLIFAPAGFALSFFPATKNVADSWWNNLFKYAVMGPMMVFFLLMTALMFNVSSDISLKWGLIQVNVRFIIAIIFLWMGLIASQKFGGMASGAAMNFAKSTGNKIKGWGKSTAGLAVSPITDSFTGMKQGVAAKLGLKGARERRRDRWAARFGDKSAEVKAVDDATKNLNIDENTSRSELDKLVASGNKYEKAAAVRELANRGQATAVELDSMKSIFGETNTVFQQLVNRVKKYDPAAAFAHITNTSSRMERINEFIKSNQFDSKKLNSNSLGNAEFMEIAMENKVISVDDIMNFRKDASKDAALTGSLRSLANTRTNIGDDVDKNIQQAYFAQTGNFNASANGNAWRKQIFSELNKDTGARMHSNISRNYSAEFAENANSGKVKDIVSNINNGNVQRQLVQNVKGGSFAAGSNAKVNQNFMENDAYMKSV